VKPIPTPTSDRACNRNFRKPKCSRRRTPISTKK